MHFMYLMFYIAIIVINANIVLSETMMNDDVETHKMTMKSLHKQLIDCHASISSKAISILMRERALRIIGRTQNAKENNKIDNDDHIVIFIHSYKDCDDNKMIDYHLDAMDLSLGIRDIVFTTFNWQSIVDILGLNIDSKDTLQAVAPYLIEFIHLIRDKYQTIDIITHSTATYLLIHALSNLLNTNQIEVLSQSTIISIESDIIRQDILMEIINNFGRRVVNRNNRWIDLYDNNNNNNYNVIKSDFLDFIQFDGLSMSNKHDININLKAIIIKYIIGWNSKIPLLNGIYSIHGFYNENDEEYLSYDVRSGNCRQIYDDPFDSKFEFIANDKNNKENGLYYIRNKYNDKRMNLWLTFDGNMVGLSSDINHRSLWKLIPIKNKKMSFKIACFNNKNNNNMFNGWLSYQYDGKWNKLYQNQHDASIYVLERIKGTKKRLLQKTEL